MSWPALLQNWSDSQMGMSAAGMTALTGVATWALARLGQRPRLSRGMAAVTGAISVALGGWWGWSALRGFFPG